MLRNGASTMLEEWRRWLHAFALRYREALPNDAMYERWRAMHMDVVGTEIVSETRETHSRACHQRLQGVMGPRRKNGSFHSRMAPCPPALRALKAAERKGAAEAEAGVEGLRPTNAYAYVTDSKLIAEMLPTVGTASLRRTLEMWLEDHKTGTVRNLGKTYPKKAPPKCEDCMVKLALFRLEGGRRRWCPGCAQAHPGAITDASSSLCEDCHLRARTFGIRTGERVARRWCGGCAKGHDGAVSSDKRRKLA